MHRKHLARWGAYSAPQSLQLDLRDTLGSIGTRDVGRDRDRGEGTGEEMVTGEGEEGRGR